MWVLLVHAGQHVSSLYLQLESLQNRSIPHFLVCHYGHLGLVLLLLAFIWALILGEVFHTVAGEIFVGARRCAGYTFFIRGLYYAIMNAHRGCCWETVFHTTSMLLWIFWLSRLLIIQSGQRLDHKKHVCEERFQIISKHILLVFIAHL